MKTSRIDGVLVMETKTPYRMAHGGKMKDATQIILKSVNEKVEAAAFDLEQLVMSGVMGLTTQQKKTESKQAEKDDKENEEFEDNDSPTAEQIDKFAAQLGMMMKLQSVVRISHLFEEFEHFMKNGCVRLEGDIKMQDVAWKTISSSDKFRIMMAYIVFFVKPLQNAAKLTTIITSSHNVGEPKELEML